MSTNRNQICFCCLIVIIIALYYYFLHPSFSKKKTTTQSEMYAAILVTSSTCPHCIKQIDILEKLGGPQAKERIKILDTSLDSNEIKEIMGEVNSVPTWYDPLTGYKSSGLKTIPELKNMGILFE